MVDAHPGGISPDASTEVLTDIFFTSTPCSASWNSITCFTSALHPPHPVAALVHCLMAPISVAPALCWQISPLLTL